MKAKTRPLMFFGLILLIFRAVPARASSTWEKSISLDKVFSFHCPKCWKVDAKESTIEITNPATPASRNIERNGRAFLFVLEFALGAPLTAGQEGIILGELRRGWETRPEEELQKYDAYPKIVEAITHATDAKAVEDLRRQLEQSIREWLETSDTNDPAVAVVAAELKLKGKVLVPGEQALTVMGADAYSEMYAYSELLQEAPQAALDRVSPSVVAEVKSRLLKAWPSFSAEQRSLVSQTPGLWVSLRSVLRFGSTSERDRVRAELGKVAAPGAESGGQSAASAGTGHSRVKTGFQNMVKHQVLMNIQQLTFNHYLFCHGFKSTIF
jgi:hypothetical protein